MLSGALAAAVTPLADDRLDEDAFGPYVEFLAAAGVDGLLALGTTGEGMLFDAGRAAARARALRRGLGGPPAGRGALRGADHRRHASRSSRTPPSRRRRGRGDRAAVLPARRAGAARALRRGGRRVRAAAVLRLRVRARERLRRPARRSARSCASGAEPRRPEGLRHTVRPLLAVPDRRTRRLRRPGVADLRRDRARARSARSPVWRLPFRTAVAAVVREPTEAGASRARGAAGGGRALSAPRGAEVHPRTARRPDARRTCGGRCGS